MSWDHAKPVEEEAEYVRQNWSRVLELSMAADLKKHFSIDLPD
jgi:hypothetical protein